MPEDPAVTCTLIYQPTAGFGMGTLTLHRPTDRQRQPYFQARHSSMPDLDFYPKSKPFKEEFLDVSDLSVFHHQTIGTHDHTWRLCVESSLLPSSVSLHFKSFQKLTYLGYPLIGNWLHTDVIAYSSYLANGSMLALSDTLFTSLNTVNQTASL